MSCDHIKKKNVRDSNLPKVIVFLEKTRGRWKISDDENAKNLDSIDDTDHMAVACQPEPFPLWSAPDYSKNS